MTNNFHAQMLLTCSQKEDRITLDFSLWCLVALLTQSVQNGLSAVIVYSDYSTQTQGDMY